MTRSRPAILTCLAMGLLTVGCAPSGAQRRAMFDRLTQRDNPELRRRTVVEMSTHRWGQGEDYARVYAEMAVGDEDPHVRAEAVRALGRCEVAGHVEALGSALNDPDPHVRLAAARVLSEHPRPEAPGLLATSARNDEDVDVRSESAWALRHYNEPTVIATLYDCLGDGEFAVRYRAHHALVELAGVDPGPEQWHWQVAAKGELPPKDPAKWWDPFGALSR